MCEMSGVCVWGFAVDFCDGGHFVPWTRSTNVTRCLGACVVPATYNRPLFLITWLCRLRFHLWDVPLARESPQFDQPFKFERLLH